MPLSRSRRRYLGLGIVAVLILGIILALGYETRTSALQSRYFRARTEAFSYRVAPGASDSVVYPSHGPYDERRGYAKIPGFLERLPEYRYHPVAQPRFSPGLLAYAGKGYPVPYHEKPTAGLVLLAAEGDTLYRASFPRYVYRDFDSIPEPVRRTLVFIEDRQLLDFEHPYRNPAVEWDRLAKAVLDQAVGLLRPDHPQPGGSTLATQLEKYRHFPGGITGSPVDKLHQMIAASHRAYLDGRDTRAARRRILLEYLNSVPLSSLAGYGEVTGIGEGLWAWFGTDPAEASAALRGEEPEDGPALTRRATAFKQILALMISQKRPLLFLIQDPGRLNRDTDRYLGLLAREGVISDRLRDAAREVVLEVHRVPVAETRPAYVDLKAANAARARLLPLLGLNQLYVLDRIDLRAETTLIGPAQRQVARRFQSLADPAVLDSLRLRGPRLLGDADPGKVVYSLTLYETTPGENLLRIQVDNWDQPLNVNEGTKLDLGSSAKLRTLVTYLELVSALHAAHAGRPAGSLRESVAAARDPIRVWSLEYLATAPDTTLDAMLEAALERTYSASPAEGFFTGGGVHHFENFTRDEDGRAYTVREALHQSVNLVFVRLMRDIVRYHIQEIPGYDPALLTRLDHPGRAPYLERFAEHEGRALTGRFFPRYKDQPPDSCLARLARRAGPRWRRQVAVFAFLRPDAGPDSLQTFLVAAPGEDPPPEQAARLYRSYVDTDYNLQDQGYLAGVDPLELWVARYLSGHPGATLADVIENGVEARQEAYLWLRKTKSLEKQNQRMRIMLEIEAFQPILEAWRRLGYPFDSMVPSFASSIGSSADRPAALAELVGILVNEGMRLPARRMGRLTFAPGTPYETTFEARTRPGERVLPAALTRSVRGALIGVVEQGTARRASGAFTRPDGRRLVLGGKTGTGDHRFETGIESRVVNRAATFVFLLGDRYYGTITAYVPGAEAANYRFTSSLPVQLLVELAPVLLPYLDGS